MGPVSSAALLAEVATVEHGRFLSGPETVSAEIVDFVARRVGVSASSLAGYDWLGRTHRYHQAQIREYFGYRACSVADAEDLTAWLASAVCERERDAGRVRAELLARCRAERIEPPSDGRVDRIVRSSGERGGVSGGVGWRGDPPGRGTRVQGDRPDVSADGADDAASVLHQPLSARTRRVARRARVSQQQRSTSTGAGGTRPRSTLPRVPNPVLPDRRGRSDT